MGNILFFLATDLPRTNSEDWFLSYSDTYLTFISGHPARTHKVRCTECGALNDDAAYLQFEREKNESYGIEISWRNCYVMADCGHVITEIEVT